jgi:hypothetical protein
VAPSAFARALAQVVQEEVRSPLMKGDLV